MRQRTTSHHKQAAQSGRLFHVRPARHSCATPALPGPRAPQCPRKRNDLRGLIPRRKPLSARCLAADPTPGRAGVPPASGGVVAGEHASRPTLSQRPGTSSADQRAGRNPLAPVAASRGHAPTVAEKCHSGWRPRRRAWPLHRRLGFRRGALPTSLLSDLHAVF